MAPENENSTPPVPSWIVARLFMLELLAGGVLTLYLANLKYMPEPEEVAARLKAFRECGLAGAAMLPPDIQGEAEAYLRNVIDHVQKAVQFGRAVALHAPDLTGGGSALRQ